VVKKGQCKETHSEQKEHKVFLCLKTEVYRLFESAVNQIEVPQNPVYGKITWIS